MPWNDLTLSDKARMIDMAVKSGITDLATIQEVYNTFSNGGNIHKYETRGPKGTPSTPISAYLKKLAKDAAYKIAVDDEIMRRGNATVSDIVRALATKKEDILEDDNKRAYIYGTGDRYPEVKEPIQGFDYSNYFKKVGYKDIKDVYGTINPEGAYHIDEEYEPLLRALAEHNYHFYDNADDMFLDSDSDNLGYRDDVGNFIHQLGVDEKGNIVIHDSDVYDFYPGDYNYTRDVGTKATKIQARLMEMIGTPYTIRQENQPVVFDGNFGQAAWNITSHLDDLTTEDIAKATQSGIVPESIVVATQKAFGGNLYGKGGPIELPSSYKKLSKEWKMRIDTLAKEHGANPAKIEEYYNEGRLTPLIGAYYTLKDNGRQRLNDTRTAEESMKHTTNSNKVMYGNVIKDPKTPSNNPQSGSPNFDAMVPYILDKEARVLGNRVSTNLFDSLAVRVPKVKNASMQDAVGIVFQETGGGSVPWGNTNKTKEENTALLNGNYWREYGWMPAEYFGRDYRYNLEEHEISRNTHPFEHMLQYFEAGKYNPGDPNHTSDVRNKGKEVMNTPAFKEWEKTSPYAKKIRMYHKYGGTLKLMTNL